MIRRPVRAMAASVAWALLLVSCSSGSDGSARSGSAVATTAPPATATNSTVDDTALDENPFAQAGITITSIDAPVAGPGLTLTDWQSANLLRDADAGQGITGAELRAGIPMPDGEMPIDLMIGAWVLDGATPIAELAQSMMPTLDFDDTADVIIPSAVVVLFTYEATLADADGNVPSTIPATEPIVVQPITLDQLTGDEQAASSQPNGLARPGVLGVPAQAGNICSALLAFQETVLGLVFDALGGKDSWLGQKAQVAIGLLPKAAQAYAIPSKGALDVLMALGFVASLVGSVSPWTISLQPDEDPIAYGIAPGAGVRGTVRTVVDPGPVLKWPEALKSCAQLLHIDLPDITPVGGVVHWEPTLGSHATETSQDGVIMDVDGVYQATLLYDTAVESAQQATGPATSGAIVFEATVDRPGNETFDKIVSKIIAQYAGDGIIGAALDYITADVAATIKKMSDPAPALRIVTVTFHEPPPDPVTTDSATPAPVGSQPDAASACVGVDLYSQPAPGQAAGVRLRLEPTGRAMWDFGASQPYSVTDEAGITVTIQLGGSLTGTYTGSGDPFTSTVKSINMVGTVSVLGVTTALPAEAFTPTAADPEFFATSEDLMCSPDGSITVVRTGQVYS